MHWIQARDGGLERVPAGQRIDLDRAVRGRGADVVQDVPRRDQHAGRNLEARPHRVAAVQDPAQVSGHRPGGHDEPASGASAAAGRDATS